MKGSIVREFGVFCLLVGGAAAVIGGVLLVWPPLSLIVGGCLAIWGRFRQSSRRRERGCFFCCAVDCGLWFVADYF